MSHNCDPDDADERERRLRMEVLSLALDALRVMSSEELRHQRYRQRLRRTVIPGVIAMLAAAFAVGHCTR